jgi:glycerate kinase
MKILVAINPYKGTLTSDQISKLVKQHYDKFGYQVTAIPVSDGGDGFIDAIKSFFKVKPISVKTKGPLMDDLESEYIIINNTAFIELSSSSGLNKIEKSKQNPMLTTTYGFGLLIKHAIESKVNKIVLGIGGSATNDGGAGMLQALGVKFYDKDGEITRPISGGILNSIIRIDTDEFKQKIKGISFEVASDVTNPLLGTTGCAHTYSPQKGANSVQIDLLEANMEYFSKITNKHFNTNHINNEGSGAGGGIGYGIFAYLDAKFNLGINLILDLFNIEKLISETDVVFVGEGKLDSQTNFGKAPFGIANLAKKHSKKVIGLFAIADFNSKPISIDEIYTIVPNITNFDNSHDDPVFYFNKMLENVRL